MDLADANVKGVSMHDLVAKLMENEATAFFIESSTNAGRIPGRRHAVHCPKKVGEERGRTSDLSEGSMPLSNRFASSKRTCEVSGKLVKMSEI